MKRQILKSLFALLVLVLFPLKAFASPSYIVVGYAPGYNSNPGYNFTGNFAGDIPWADLSHVYYAFATIGGTAAAMDDGSGVAAAICTQAHAHGVRCYISVGGANPAGQWGSVTTVANAQTLANSITSLIHYGGVTFDGVDVDWEFPTSAAVFNALLQQIRTNLNAITPGLAPSGKYTGESAEGLTMYLSPGSSVCGYGFTTSNSIVDWYTDSGYDLNVNVVGDQWNGALTDPGNTQFTNCNSNSMQLSILTVANWYNTVGYGGTIPYNKMVLGMPLYGRNVGGTTTTPDAVAFGGSGSGYNATAKEEVWGGNSMDTAQSFCDKMNWAIGAKGMKGIAMWDLGQGLPTNTNSMMTSIWNVINGSSACLTVGGGPGSPTATPTSTPSCGTLVADFESGSAQDNLGGFTSLSAGGCTLNPAPWGPTSGYGLSGTTYGARFYGTTTGCTYGPSLLVPLGVGATPKYNASAAGQNSEQFHIKITTGPATPATIVVGVVPTNGTTSGFQYNLVIQPASFGQDLTETVFFSQMAYAYGTVTTLDTTQLYQLYYEPLWPGNYDITVDQIEFVCAPTPTPTPTNTYTATFTNTYTPTKTLTFTATNTYTPTPTFTVAPPTNTFTFTPTFTNSFTNTPTKTNTFTNTFTNTPTITNTFTPPAPTNTFTNSPTKTNSFTSTFTYTLSFTNTFTNTSTPTFTKTFTNSPTNTLSPTNTGTPTNTFTGTVPPTNTPTNTLSPTKTDTNTNTPTNTLSPTNTFTNTPAIFTNTFTNTPTATFTPTNTGTFTFTGTSTFTSTNTDTFTNTNTLTFTNTPTVTFTPTLTFTGTQSPTATQPVVQVGNGANSPTNQTVPAGTSNQVVMQLSANDTSGENLQLNSLTLTFTGTGNAATGISSITIWKDPSGNGTTSGSSVLATVVSPFASGNSVVVNFSDIVGAGTTGDYLVTYNYSSGAPSGTYSVSVANAGALTGQGVTSGKSLNVIGAPVNGAIDTIVANTATFTPTNSFTPTSTNTPIFTFTSTSTLTPTPTFTATQPVVQVGNGPNSPANQTVPAGSSNQVVLQLSADDTSGENLKLNSLTLTFTGTGNAATGISSITLWKDPSGNGTTSGSSVLATVVSPFASGNTVNINFSDIVNAITTQDYLVTYTFSSGAPAGTYSVSVSTGAALMGQGVTSGKSLQVQGAPVNGAVFTINALTATPTFTPTATSSFTATFTATPTLSHTPVPVVTMTGPYPNPVSGTGTVSLNVTAPAASSLSWSVFTTSFRKVWDDTIPVPAGMTTIQWNMRDRNGIPVSDGLYYFRIQVNGLHSTTKIYKVLVLQ